MAGSYKKCRNDGKTKMVINSDVITLLLLRSNYTHLLYYTAFPFRWTSMFFSNDRRCSVESRRMPFIMKDFIGSTTWSVRFLSFRLGPISPVRTWSKANRPVQSPGAFALGWEVMRWVILERLAVSTLSVVYSKCISVFPHSLVHGQNTAENFRFPNY